MEKGFYFDIRKQEKFNFNDEKNKNGKYKNISIYNINAKDYR